MTSIKIRYCLTALVCLLTPLSCVAQGWSGDKHHPFLSFEVSGSKATYPVAINEARTVTGYYITAAGVTNGFVREDDGHIITFDIPGSVSTQPVSINAAGEVTGFYNLATTTDLLPVIPQGFLRKPDGKITTFGNTANTDSSASFWAQPVSINDGGEIVGNFPDIVLSSNVFLRSATGVISSFGIGLGAGDPTYATGLNASGAIIGYTGGGSDTEFGFLWDGQGQLPNPAGNFTQITVSGSTATYPIAINADGAVVGCYSVNNVNQDFVRYPDGSIQTLDVPGTVPPCLTNPSSQLFSVPQPLAINDRGTILGSYLNENKISRAFVRFDDGKLITFEHPGSQQTTPTSINNCDVITGYYTRGSVIRGFIREP